MESYPNLISSELKLLKLLVLKDKQVLSRNTGFKILNHHTTLRIINLDVKSG